VATTTPPVTPTSQQPDKPDKIKRGFDYWRVYVRNDTNIARYNLAKETRKLPTEIEALQKEGEMNSESKGLRSFVRNSLETRFVRFAQNSNLMRCGMRVMTKSQVFRAIRDQLS
jgi:hypothetical protein